MFDRSALRDIVDRDLRRNPQKVSDFCLEYSDANPDDPHGYFVRGLAQRQLGGLDFAVRLLGEAVSLAPEQPAYLFVRGNVLFELERYEAAAADYIACRRCDTDGFFDCYPTTYLAECYFRLGRYDEAEAVCRDIPDDAVIPGFRDLLNGSKHFILADIARARAGAA